LPHWPQLIPKEERRLGTIVDMVTSVWRFPDVLMLSTAADFTASPFVFDPKILYSHCDRQLSRMNTLPNEKVW
jgi:hypothetical protein